MHICTYLECKLLWPKNPDKNGKHFFVKVATILKIMIGLDIPSGFLKNTDPKITGLNKLTYLGWARLILIWMLTTIRARLDMIDRLTN